MPEYDPVTKISIVPRGQAGGLTFFAPSEERLESGLYSRSVQAALLKDVRGMAGQVLLSSWSAEGWRWLVFWTQGGVSCSQVSHTGLGSVTHILWMGSNSLLAKRVTAGATSRTRWLWRWAAVWLRS